MPARSDLQIHTPASHLNNQFGDDWDAYIQRLFRAAIQRELAVIGLTDYFTIDGYKIVKQQYLSDPEKLDQLFTPDEIEQIKRIGIHIRFYRERDPLVQLDASDPIKFAARHLEHG